MRLDITQNDENKDLAFDKYVSDLYILGTEKYFKMGAGQYLRNFRRDFQWKKKEAHRKKVLMRSQKEALLSGKVQMDSIKSDTSTNKVSSHILLLAMLEKHPRIFHETRLYTNKDPTILLKAYGVSQKGKKEVMAEALVAAIKGNSCLPKADVFDDWH